MSPKKTPYVTGSLRRIGEQLADAKARLNAQPGEERADSEAEAGIEAPKAAQEELRKPVRNQEAEKALRLRHEETLRLRRDVSARLAEQLAALPEELDALQARADAIVAAEERFKAALASVNALEEPNPDDDAYSQKLAECAKTLENARLETIMTLSKLEKNALRPGVAPAQGGSSGQGSILPELSSLGFRQLFKFGLCLTLPVAAAVVLGGFIIAVAIVCAMRLGI